MRKIALLCTVAALAACSEAETTNNAAAAVEPPAAEATAAAWKIEPGSYEYTRSDGATGVNTLAADGTFSNAMKDGKTENGTWVQEGDLTCLTPAEGERRCYNFTQPDADGNFTGTTTAGVTVTVRKKA